MSRRPEISDCAGEAAAYALGALEPSEAERFARHLEQCAICRDELAALRGVVQALPMAAPQHVPSPRLRKKLMRAIGERPNAVRRARRSSSMRWRVGLVPRLAGAAAAATIAAGAIVTGGVLLWSGKTSGRTIQARVVGDSGSAELRVAGGHGELIVHHLSPPPAGHVYEVWLKPPNAPPAPASVLFTVNSVGAADVALPGGLRGIRQVMVTSEPAGGSWTPTTKPVIVVQLT